MHPHQAVTSASIFGARTALVSSVLAFVIFSACGSEDGKKKIGPEYESAGEGGGHMSGASGNAGGSAGESATGNGGQGASSTVGGAGNEGGLNPGVAGQGTGGEAGAPATACPSGTA